MINRPTPALALGLLLGILLAVLGFQSISIGLLGELIIYTHARGMRTYRIAEEL